jgi:hypothetical protein
MNDQIPEMETCARLTPIVYTPHGEPLVVHNAGRLAWDRSLIIPGSRARRHRRSR